MLHKNDKLIRFPVDMGLKFHANAEHESFNLRWKIIINELVSQAYESIK